MKIPISAEELAKLCESYSDRELGRRYGCHHATIQSWRRFYHIPRTSKGLSGRYRKWFFDECFFDILDTPEKAYIFGLICADGHIDHSNYSLTITLKETDGELLEQVRASISSNQPFLRIAKPSGTGGPQLRFTAQSKHLYYALTLLGLTDNKSCTVNYPILRPELESHFCRGVLDGDGWIGERQAVICGTEMLISGMVSAIKHHTDVHVRGPVSHGPMFRLEIGRRTSRALHWFYQDSTIHLLRKYSVFKEHWS